MTEAQFRALALSASGADYEFGGEVAPSAPKFDNGDCSEFVQWLYAHAGAPICDGSANQYDATWPASKPLRMGDLFFGRGTYRPGISHVGVYIGNGQTAEMRSTLRDFDRSTVSEVEKRSSFAGWRRYPALKLSKEAISMKRKAVVGFFPDARVSSVRAWARANGVKLLEMEAPGGKITLLHADDAVADRFITWAKSHGGKSVVWYRVTDDATLRRTNKPTDVTL